jgi:putative salt-induced outer membrane protein
MHSRTDRIPVWPLSALALCGLAATSVCAQSGVEQTPRWESNAAIGFTLTSGNSDTLLATANVLTQKKWDRNELRFGADAAYGEQEDIKNNEFVRGFGQYNRLFSDRCFGYVRAEALHDAIADVEYRVTLSPGAGYYFIKNDRTSLSLEVGPGVVFEKQGARETTYLTLRVAERFEHKFSKTARIWQSAEWLPQVDDFNNYIINAEVGVAAALTEKLELQAVLQDTYDNEPAPGRKSNDIKLITRLGYKF